MQNKTVTIVNKRGLHARAAAKFVSVASKYSCQVLVLKDNNQLNGKSIMGLLSLAASIGSQLTIQTDGEDEKDAIAEITDLVERGFDESDD